MPTLKLTIPPPLLFILHALMMWVISAFFTSFHVNIPYRLALSCIGLIVVSLPGLIALLSFIHHHTTVDPTRPQKTSYLVTDGIYRLSRNPMYLSLVGVLMILGIFLANIIAICMPVGLVLSLTYWQIIPEEKVLQQRFGNSYLTYQQQVRRWL